MDKGARFTHGSHRYPDPESRQTPSQEREQAVLPVGTAPPGSRAASGHLEKANYNPLSLLSAHTHACSRGNQLNGNQIINSNFLTKRQRKKCPSHSRTSPEHLKPHTGKNSEFCLRAHVASFPF